MKVSSNYAGNPQSLCGLLKKYHVFLTNIDSRRLDRASRTHNHVLTSIAEDALAKETGLTEPRPKVQSQVPLGQLLMQLSVQLTPLLL